MAGTLGPVNIAAPLPWNIERVVWGFQLAAAGWMPWTGPTQDCGSDVRENLISDGVREIMTDVWWCWSTLSRNIQEFHHSSCLTIIFRRTFRFQMTLVVFSSPYFSAVRPHCVSLGEKKIDLIALRNQVCVSAAALEYSWCCSYLYIISNLSYGLTWVLHKCLQTSCDLSFANDNSSHAVFITKLQASMNK